MPAGLGSLIISLLLMLLLAAYAYRATPGTRLRQAFALGSGAMSAITGLNAMVLVQISAGWFPAALIALALALFLGSVISFTLAIWNGELRAKLQQAQRYVADERARRELQRPNQVEKDQDE